jgi:hypothetical protein
VYENATEFKNFSHNSGFLYELWPTALELRESFQKLLKTATRFGCTANGNLGHDVICMSRAYVQIFNYFLLTLNGITADQN